MEVSMLIKAFLVGGGICAIGQLLIDYTKLTPTHPGFFRGTRRDFRRAGTVSAAD